MTKKKTKYKIKKINPREKNEETVLDITKAILTSYEANTITLPPKSSINTLPADLQTIIRENRKLRRDYTRQSNPATKLALNVHSTKMRLAIKKHREDTRAKKTQSLNTEDNSVWILQKRLRNPTHYIPPIHGRNGLAYSDEEKANAFADTLESVLTENIQEDEDENLTDRMENDIEELRATESPVTAEDFTTPEEVHKIIKHQKTRKAPGYDNINNKMLKELPKKLIVAITNLTNAIMKYDYFPNYWKKSIIIVIGKPGKDPTFPDNYRPISLLPTISKVVERVIKKRIVKFSEENNIIPQFQFGFRSAHSAEQQAYKITEYITKGFSSKLITGACFLDIERAFDKLWHTGLIIKMIRLGFPTKIVKLVDSYITNRTFKVKIGNTTSLPKEIMAGVPQGSVLGPILYSIYISDIPVSNDVMTALYADDTAILTQSKRADIVTDRLQENLDKIHRWCNINKIKINSNKTQAIIFQKRRVIPENQLTLDDVQLQWCDEIKYLGLIMDKKLTWRRHIRNKVEKVNGVITNLIPIIGRRSKTSYSTKKLIIQSVIRPILNYGSTVWGYAAKTHINRIVSTENKTLRMSVNAPWYVRNVDIHRDIGWTPHSDFIVNKANKFYLRLLYQPNKELQKLSSYDPAYEKERASTYHKRPRDLFVIRNAPQPPQVPAAELQLGV